MNSWPVPLDGPLGCAGRGCGGRRGFEAGNGEGPRGGRPFHCRAVVRLNYRKDVVFRRPGPPRRQGSSSRMPATAAIDNETLDHLLSMTDLAFAALGRPALAKFHDWANAKSGRAWCRERG